MCTLTYLPFSKQSFLLSSNRDEKIMREAALPPELKVHHKGYLLYPHDPKGNGSWIAASSFGRVACLLNGAEEKHISAPPYRISRGLVLLALFDYKETIHFINDFSFEGIEPFTLVVWEQQSLKQIRWDGIKPKLVELDASKPHIWSSVTLYDAAVIKARQDFFYQYIEQFALEPMKAMLNFHRFNGNSDFPFGIEMQAGGSTQTVSISQLLVDQHQIGFNYLDTLSKIETFQELRVHPLSEVLTS